MAPRWSRAAIAEVVVQRAKAFFYVCAGLLLLALTYHLGAGNARAQGVAVECAGIDTYFGGVAMVTDQHLHRMNFGGGPETVTLPPPGTDAVVACSPHVVVLANGDVWNTLNSNLSPPYSWVLGGNVLNTSTPTVRHTLGQLKQRYR